jgi:hypothetical protein
MPGPSEEDIMNKTILFALLASSTAALAFAGCSSSSGNNTTAGDASTSDVTTGDDGGTDSAMQGNDSATTGDSPSEATSGPPAPPALGTQIDRMGRPAINTALNHVFDPACAAPGLCAAKDTYNADNNPANWSSADGGYVPQIYGNLAIFDALDTVCGNQAGFGALATPGYGVLATVLSQDALWLNTTSTTCNQYLGVELNALGISNSDCGGRTLTEDTIDATYQVLAGVSLTDAGALAPGPVVVTNGITAPSKAPTTTFPYFASPH